MQMVNRTFFTLISISLVAAAARHAYDQLGNFFPRHLRYACLHMSVWDTCNSSGAVKASAVYSS